MTEKALDAEQPGLWSLFRLGSEVEPAKAGSKRERLWKFATSTYLPCAKCTSSAPLAVPCMVKRTLSQCRPTVVALALSWPDRPTQSFLSTIWDLLFPRLCLQYFFDSIELPGACVDEWLNCG